MTPDQNAHVKTLISREEIFDYVESHLKKQGYRSMLSADFNTCAYRGEDDTMCAVGCLIADDEYNPDMENDSIMELAGLLNTGAPFRVPALPERLISHVGMLTDLQDLHDRSENWTPGKGLSHRGIDHLQRLRRMWLEDGVDLT